MAVAEAWTRLNWSERIALLAILITPAALYLDFRTGLAPVRDVVRYRPIGESGGRTVEYLQILGWTQIVWLSAGVVAVARPTSRTGARSATTVLLTTLLVLLVAVTSVRGGIDRTTIVALGATLVPMIAMAIVLLNAGIREATRRTLIGVLAAETVAVVVLTLAKKTYGGTLRDRFEMFVVGPPTETGIVLAALVLLVFAAPWRTSARIALAIPLGGALLLTETRGAILAVLAGALVLAVLRPRWRWVTIAVAIAGITAFVIASGRSATFADVSTTYRWQNLSHHWDLLVREPLLGYGVNNQGIDDFRSAHAVLLGMANAGGVLAAGLFVAAWVAPVVYRLSRLATFMPYAVGAATIAAVFVGWHTTGTEILIYAPPTNVLPLLLATALLRPPLLASPRRASPDS